MIPEAVFREFPAKTLRKLPVSGRNPTGSVRNSTQESGDRIPLPVLTGSCWFRAKQDKSGHRNTAEPAISCRTSLIWGVLYITGYELLVKENIV
jgi:hypothetical protein